MESFIFLSYLTSTIAYTSLFLFAIIRKKRYWLFILSALLSAFWSGAIVRTTQDSQFFLADTLIFETLRNVSWFFLLAALLSRQKYGNDYQYIRSRLALPIGLFVSFAASIEAFPNFLDFIHPWIQADPRFFAHVVSAVLGLILIEQLYRNTPLNQRWNLKFICLGLAALFVADLFTYSKSLLYKHLDIASWQSRGIINALLVPFLAIALPRLDDVNQNLEQTSPRKTVFYTTILFGCGVYLILMSAAGYYLKHANAEWGETVQTVFIFLAILLLAVSFTSGKIRALAKVYFGKHFFHYSYDYREEWLKISKALAKLESLEELKNFIITTLMSLVESSGGGLWLKNEQGQFVLAAEQNLRLTPQELDHLKNGKHLPEYLANKQWVIDFFELAHAPEVYEDIDLSPWCYEDSQVWLIVPLFHLNHLEAFAVLTQPRVPRKLNWEDHDLLKTVGMQLANAIALNKASEALASNRQFEAYHRLSAYLVHDLKNITAQISLIVKNADKHKHNPDFFDDTIDTLNNVFHKMQHIVEQLRQGNAPPSSDSQINLVDVILKIKRHHIGSPPLQFETTLENCIIRANLTKLNSIITNLIQNAQEATQKPGGWVKLVLSTDQDYAVIDIMDNGVGMDQQFIAERLFKPFDTTKGNAGMGIGAYEARDYILKNAGKMNVKSQPGEGTSFTLHLPLAHNQ
ncbi:PEP-CTERM system histidine kinase PrsK [Methylomonas sp. LL1]|uniref:XrtA/PEP-CTERM system histidine kinase PrsK n=1 Tax=Methylomonas sp. LL1 TaxID=2785785 RepID=UPI0018C3601C|nr:XrtA/PEP-CTERM system histidine kinase PrsK [Methylomonas sp. LL1]QPK63288.1 PEP-CTERM system histidine kinase PrsK [Methylomonas sp. LL1]CAG1021795.1 Sporulation kinase E [Methylococcales bacterium]